MSKRYLESLPEFNAQVEVDQDGAEGFYFYSEWSAAVGQDVEVAECVACGDDADADYYICDRCAALEFEAMERERAEAANYVS